MPSSKPVERLNEIVENCNRIFRHIRGMSFDGYLEDEKTRDAVERCLQRISEAACKLGSDLDAIHPDVPWRQARGVGNVLRHRYDEVSDLDIWQSITEDLPVLKLGATKEIQRLLDQERHDGTRSPEDEMGGQ